MEKTTVRTGISMPKEVYEHAKKMAKQSHMTLSGWFTQLILNEYKKKGEK